MLTIKCIQCGKEEEFEHTEFNEADIHNYGWTLDVETLSVDGVCPDC